MSPIRSIFLLLCTLTGLAATHVFALPVSKADTNARVFIAEPADGAVVSSPVTVKFGLENMTVIPAGISHPNSGHHHLLVDVEKLPDLSQPIPADVRHIHFGKGQKETTLELTPGPHTLQLLMGDHLHRPHNNPVLSEKVTITVKASEQASAADAKDSAVSGKDSALSGKDSAVSGKDSATSE